ncbi:hypothetical protein AVEN_48315-1 [Araneus ventricosus]|uniref:Monocarboxylate transporter 9 n=1 Tax=Araneus ventricosus TaxID=182803 RepID=A0A4Y2SJY9_ARAVE|nr:hypothetical protein AVEN_48315-1 [Araneus ventricosus]
MAANPNRFSESEPLLRTRIHQTEEEGFDINKKICGFRVEGPDGARACWVAFAAFFISFVMAGIGRVYGIMLPHLLTVYGIDREMASIPFSLQLAFRNLFGPLVGILGHKFGVRKITFLGIVIASLSTAVSGLFHSYQWVIVCWGGITGFGVAFGTNLLQLSIGQYFVKNKATAMGMSLAGGCLGSIALPPVVECLLQLLPLKIVFVCMGGIILSAAPFSLTFKVPPWLNAKNQSSENYKQLNVSRAIVSLENSFLENQDDSASTEATFPRNMPNITFLRKHKKLIIKLLRRATILELKMSEKEKLRLETSILINIEDLLQYINKFLRNFTEKSFMSSEYQKQSLKAISVSNGKNLRVGEHSTISLTDIAENSNDSTRISIIKKLEKISLMTLSEVLAVCPNENKHDILNISRELRNLCNAAARLEKQENGYLFFCGSGQDVPLQNEASSNFNSKYHRMVFLVKSIWKPVFLLYTNLLFLLISISRLAHFITFVPVLPTIEDFLVEKGLPKSDGQYGVISLSVGDFIGRMFTGWVTDRGYLSLPNFMAIIMFFQFFSTVTLPVISNRCMRFIALSIFGLLQGSIFVRHPVLISNYMDKHEQPFAMGCLSFFSGIFACVLPFYIGLSKDIIGTYDFMFYISGPLGAFIGLIWCIIPKLEVFYSVEETTKESDEPV